MGDIYFYHLTRAPLEATLPVLLKKSRERGWRVVVRSPSHERLAWLDERLWTHPEESFLAHGRAGGPHDRAQPVLLTTQQDAPNGAACLMAIDGAAVTAEELSGFERVCILFDGNDETAVEAARGQWRALTEAGVTAQYWSEDSGRWQMKAGV